MNAEQIEKFIQDYFTWTHIDRSITPTCDREAFLDWQCCLFHRQSAQEREHFLQTAQTIESQFPAFYQGMEHRPSVLSQAWFLQLSAVSGISLPDRKMANWLTASAQIVYNYLEASIGVHSFTLLFRSGAVAVLQVHGIKGVDEARAFASNILPQVSYEVRDGDETNGHVQTFHAWTCVEAQQECPKKIVDLTDVELEQMCEETEAVIDRLLEMDQLTGKAEQDREQQLHAALGLEGMLELEQIRRLVRKAVREVGGHP